MTTGLMLAHAYPEILKLTIPAMLRRVNWAVVYLNNADQETIATVNKLAFEHRKKLHVVLSDIKHPEYDSIKKRLHWWRKTRVKLRDGAWQSMLSIAKNYYQVPDVVWWPDADELPNASFDPMLKKFIDSDYEAAALCPADVFDDMSLVKGWSMAPHCRIYKRVSEIDVTKRGYRKAGRFHPITGDKVMTIRYATVHLPYLFSEYRKERHENWKRPDYSDDQRVRNRRPFNGLWSLPKPADQCTSDEIKKALAVAPCCRVNDYLKKKGLTE